MKEKQICAFLLLLSVVDMTTDFTESLWSYLPDSKKGPNFWKFHYPSCGQQDIYSPLDLSFDKSEYSADLRPAQFEGHWVSDRKSSMSIQLQHSLLGLFSFLTIYLNAATQNNA